MQWLKILFATADKNKWAIGSKTTLFLSCQQRLGERCPDFTTGSALAIQSEVLTRDTENNMCEIFTRWILFLKQLYTLLSKTYLFENHKLKSCQIYLQAQSCFSVVFSIPYHHRSTDEGSSCNQNKCNQQKHIFHGTLRSSVITRPCGNKPFYDAFIQGLSFSNCGEYLICFLSHTFCN